jgi:hypothetical protein
MLFAYRAQVVFINGGDANKVTWQVGSSATIMADCQVVGNIIAYASITSTANSNVNGRLLAR